MVGDVGDTGNASMELNIEKKEDISLNIIHVSEFFEGKFKGK